MTWFFHLAFIISVAGLTHCVSLLAFPSLSQRDAFSLLDAHAPENAIAIIPEQITQELPYFDPYIQLAVCRYNLASGPVRIRTPLNGAYVVIVLIEPGRGIFSSMSDRAASQGIVELVVATKSQSEQIKASYHGDAPNDEVLVQAPKPTGLALIKVLIDRPSHLDKIKETLAKSSCSSEELKGKI